MPRCTSPSLAKQKTAPKPGPRPSAPKKTAPKKPQIPHTWIVAAQIDVTEKQARRAMKYQSYWTDQVEQIKVLDIYCKMCRRNMEDVADNDCQAKINNDYLYGGDRTQRAKRKPSSVPKDAVIVPAARIHRYGIDAVINGEA